MNYVKRPISEHRRARLAAWALAMLFWLASVLFCGGAFTDRHHRQRGPRMSLAGLERMVKLLILSRANDLARMRWRKRRSRAYRGVAIGARHAVRALIGARLRRLLKRKTLGERISVLIHALRNLDAYAARIAKRGYLTRRWLKLFAAPVHRSEPCTTLVCTAPCPSDSS